METQIEVQMTELKKLKSKKLWHQLNMKLLDIVKNIDVQNIVDLVAFYDTFLKPIENKMNYFYLAAIISYMIPSFKTPEDAITFLECFEAKV